MKATAWITLAVAVGLVGCTTSPSQHYPSTVIDMQGNRHKIINRIIYPGNSSIDKPATKDTVYQTCPFENWDPKTDILIKLEECVSEHDHDTSGHIYTRRVHDSNGPILSNAIPAAIIAGGIMGGAAIVRPSKTSVSQSNSQSNSTDASIDFNVSTINPPLPKR